MNIHNKLLYTTSSTYWLTSYTYESDFNKIKQRSPILLYFQNKHSTKWGNRKVILQTGFTFAQKLYLKMRLILLLLIFTGYNSYSQCAYDYYVSALDKSKSRDYKDAIRDYTKFSRWVHNTRKHMWKEGIVKPIRKDKVPLLTLTKQLL
jgi:hypothetical protein